MFEETEMSDINRNQGAINILEVYEYRFCSTFSIEQMRKCQEGDITFNILDVS